MTQSDQLLDTSRDHDTTESSAACPGCPHTLASHDPTGVRYCAATAAAASARKCICRPDAATVAAAVAKAATDLPSSAGISRPFRV